MSFASVNSKEKLVILGISIVIGVGIIPLVLALLTPFFLIKQCVKLLAKWWKPQFVEVVSGYSKFMVVQDIYTRPKCSGTTCIIFDEGTKINMNKIEDIANQVLSQKRFAKAKQLLVPWLGFYFWQDNPQFNFRDQVVLHKELVEETEFNELGESSLLQKNFSKSKPVWEMHLFERILMEHKSDTCGNFPYGQEDDCCPNRERSGIVFLLHHTLADWYSAMDFAEAIRKANNNNRGLPSNDDESDDSSAPSDISAANNNNDSLKKKEEKNEDGLEDKKKRMSNMTIALYFVKTLLTAPTAIVYHTLLSSINTLQNRTGIVPVYEHNYFQIRIPDELLTEVARKNGVGTIPLVMASFAGALRQTLVELGIKELPEEISTTGPVPVPLKRPQKLDNFFSVMPIQLPIKEADRRKRLQQLDISIESLKSSTAPLGFLGMFEVLGSLFGWMVKLAAEVPLGAVSHTVLPGPNDLNEKLGVGIQKAVFSGAMPYGKVVMLGFFSVKTNGLLHLKVHGDKALFATEAQSRRFLMLFVREIEAFNGGVGIKYYD